MPCSAERLIEALIQVQMMEYQRDLSKRREKAKPPVIVTISRECGSLGKDVGKELARRLGLNCCDRRILHEVARRAAVDEELVEALDQHAKMRDKHWWERFLKQDALSIEDYYENLLKTVIGISRHGGVIVGRGANLILGPEHAFRVRVTSSLQSCAARIAERQHLAMQDAIEFARQNNRERAEYVRRLYDTDINDLSNYDLVLNADRFEKEQMVRLILEAMTMAGYAVAAGSKQKFASPGSAAARPGQKPAR